MSKARRTYSRLCLFTTRLNCREPIGSRQSSVHCADWTTHTVTTRSRTSGSLKTADVYAPWCHLVFRHASVMAAVVIGWYLKTGDSRFSRRIGCNVSRPGRNTVASDAWPSFKARRRWIGAKSLVCTPGFTDVAKCHNVHTSVNSVLLTPVRELKWNASLFRLIVWIESGVTFFNFRAN